MLFIINLVIGYELLLELDESIEPDRPLPPTIQGSIQALQSILDHPLVFNESQYKDESTLMLRKKVTSYNPTHKVLLYCSSHRDMVTNK